MLADILTPETVVDDSALYNELLRRVEDAQQERAQHEQQWRDNDKLVLGDHGSIFDTGKHHYFIANRARQIVDAHTAIMTEQMPRNVYAPRETGEPPDWIIRPESVQKLSAVAQMGIQLPLTPAQMQGIEYIDNETAMKILSITVPQEVQVMQEQPPGEDGEGGEPQPTTMVQQV